MGTSISYTDLVKPSVLNQPVYEPGKPIEVVAREFGIDPETTIKLASNENPLGVSPKVLEAVKSFLNQSHFYPDGGCYLLRQKLARLTGLTPGQFIFGNGSNEIFELVGHAFISEGDEVVMGEQAFIVYKLVTLLFDAKPMEVPLVDFTHDLGGMLAAVSERTKVVFLPCPNNPTGTLNSNEQVLEFAEALPEHVILVLDEAYAEYQQEPVDLRPLMADGRKIICSRTFSKIYSLAGFRIGYGYCSEECASLMNRVREPFNVNSIAQAAALAALNDQDWVDKSREVNEQGLKMLSDFFHAKGIPFVPSRGNFILAELGDCARIFNEMEQEGVIVRPMGPYGLPEYMRISIGTGIQNQRLIETLQKVLDIS